MATTTNRSTLARSEAAMRGWETRRANKGSKTSNRSEAARRGWETRRANAGVASDKVKTGFNHPMRQQRINQLFGEQ